MLMVGNYNNNVNKKNLLKRNFILGWPPSSFIDNLLDLRHYYLQLSTLMQQFL